MKVNYSDDFRPHKGDELNRSWIALSVFGQLIFLCRWSMFFICMKIHCVIVRRNQLILWHFYKFEVEWFAHTYKLKTRAFDTAKLEAIIRDVRQEQKSTKVQLE